VQAQSSDPIGGAQQQEEKAAEEESRQVQVVAEAAAASVAKSSFSSSSRAVHPPHDGAQDGVAQIHQHPGAAAGAQAQRTQVLDGQPHRLCHGGREEGLSAALCFRVLNGRPHTAGAAAAEATAASAAAGQQVPGGSSSRCVESRGC